MATTSKATSYSITTRGGRIYAATPFSRTFIAEAKRLAGARWHANDKEWSFPVYQQQAVTKLCGDVFGGGPTSATAPNGDLMFGCTEEYLRDIFDGAIASRPMMVMGILSDAQEAMMSGDIEGARQMINRAKFGIAEYLTTKPASSFTSNMRQAIPIVLGVRPMTDAERAGVHNDGHAARNESQAMLATTLADDAARGEMDRGSEPEDFDPEMGF